MKLPDGWKYIKLSDITTPLTEMAGDKKYETLSISAGIGFVNQAKKFGKELSGKQYGKYTVLQRGDFSYNKGNSKKYPQGCIYQLTDRDCAAVPNVFESFRFILGINDYYEQLFMSGFLNHQLASKINHGVRDDGLLNLTGKDFYDCFVPFPPLAEQQKIADILCEQDKIISLKQKLLEQKQQQKKWLMQKLLEVPHTNADCEEKFSLDGVVIDKSGWKKEKIKNVAEISSGSTPRRDETENFKGNILWLTSGELKQKYIFDTKEHISKQGAEKSNLTVYKPGTVVIAIYGLEATGIRGTCSIINTECTISQACMAFTNFKKVTTEYFYYWYLQNGQAIGSRYAQGTKQQNLSTDLMGNLSIEIPSFPEQKIIAQVLSTADKEIALLKSSIEQEKQKEKSLAQLLLTGTVRVKI